MNFAPFTGHIPTAAAIPSIHQFAAKFGYENVGSSSGGVLQETRYHTSGSGGGVQFAVAPAAGSVAMDGVKFRQAESVVVVSSAQPGTVTLAGIAPIHTGESVTTFMLSFIKGENPRCSRKKYLYGCCDTCKRNQTNFFWDRDAKLQTDRLMISDCRRP